MEPMMNTQRGVSYLPGASAKVREEREKRVEAEIQALREPKKEELSPNKAHAIMLDQIEHAWKERARDRGRPSR